MDKPEEDKSSLSDPTQTFSQSDQAVEEPYVDYSHFGEGYQGLRYIIKYKVGYGSYGDIYYALSQIPSDPNPVQALKLPKTFELIKKDNGKY